MPRELIRSSTSMGLGRHAYVELLERSLEWMSSLDVEVHRASRHNQYLKILERFANGVCEDSSGSWGIEQSRRIINAKYETHQIDRIRRYFEGAEPDGIKEKLKLVISGPVHFSDENHNTGKTALPRNTQLELMVGGYIRRYGFSVSYGGGVYPEPLVKHGNRSVGFECKRLGVGKVKAISRNIERAAKQVTERVSAELCDSGIVHINISKLLNPMGMVSIGPGARDPTIMTQARSQGLRFFREFVDQFAFDRYPALEAIVVTYSHFAKSNKYEEDETYMHHVMEKERNGGSPFISDFRQLARDDKSAVLSGYETSAESLEVDD